MPLLEKKKGKNLMILFQIKELEEKQSENKHKVEWSELNVRIRNNSLEQSYVKECQ